MIIMTLNKFAIVALALRFPGANNSEQFWHILNQAKETISCFSLDQSMKAGIPKSLLTQASYRPYRGVLEHLESFQYSPVANKGNDFHALSIQGKIMSHLTHEALNSMKNEPDKKTAVFIGTNNQLPIAAEQPLSTTNIKENYYLKTIAAYLAYEYGFQGTALDLYTACSSSSVAVIQACKELSSNQCNMAIAGGISINFPQEIGYLYEENGILSKDGHCRPFDKEASGTILSSGAGIIILKRLEDAIAANDFIHAVITGYGINNDGNLKTNFLAPGINGQYSCLQTAWKQANIQGSDLDYIEAHGAATPLGDAVEMYVLKKAFQSFKLRTPCPVGSIKGNIGHTIAASGIASLIKTILILQHKALVPSLNFQTFNEHILLEDLPFYIISTCQKFSTVKKNYTAGVSNFGLGGTNTHIVLQSSE